MVISPILGDLVLGEGEGEKKGEWEQKLRKTLLISENFRAFQEYLALVAEQSTILLVFHIMNNVPFL